MKNWLHRYWLVILIIVSTFIIILGFAIGVYIFKMPTDFVFTPNTADIIFDFLDKWASAGAPAIMLIGILVALGIGLVSIRQTRNIRQREYRHRLLSEIVDWAVNVSKSAFEKGVLDTSTTITPAEASGFVTEQVEQWGTFRVARGHGEYIRKIASEIDAELAKYVDELIDALRQQIKELYEYKRTPLLVYDPSAMAELAKKLATNNDQLYDSANNIMTRAAELLPKPEV